MSLRSRRGLHLVALLLHVGSVSEVSLSDLGLSYDALLQLLGMLNIQDGFGCCFTFVKIRCRIVCSTRLADVRQANVSTGLVLIVNAMHELPLEALEADHNHGDIVE